MVVTRHLTTAISRGQHASVAGELSAVATRRSLQEGEEVRKVVVELQEEAYRFGAHARWDIEGRAMQSARYVTAAVLVVWVAAGRICIHLGDAVILAFNSGQAKRWKFGWRQISSTEQFASQFRQCRERRLGGERANP